MTRNTWIHLVCCWLIFLWFFGDMEDRWREHLNRGNGETMVFSQFFEYLNHVFKLIKVSGFDFPFKSFIPSWLSPCQLPCQLPWAARGSWFRIPSDVPSGNLTKSYWKWWFIVDLPIKNGWIFNSYVAVSQWCMMKLTNFYHLQFFWMFKW